MVTTLGLFVVLSASHLACSPHGGSMNVHQQVELPPSIDGCLLKIDGHLTSNEKKAIIADPNIAGSMHLVTWISVNCVENNARLKKEFSALGLTDEETISMFVYSVYANKARNVKIDVERLLKSSLKAQEYRTKGVPKDPQ